MSKLTQSERQAIASSLATRSEQWTVKSFLLFAEEKLAEEEITNNSIPKGNIYHWTMEDLLSYVFDRYADELEAYSDETLLELMG